MRKRANKGNNLMTQSSQAPSPPILQSQPEPHLMKLLCSIPLFHLRTKGTSETSFSLEVMGPDVNDSGALPMSGLLYQPQQKADCEIMGEGEESTKPLFPHTLVLGQRMARRRK